MLRECCKCKHYEVRTSNDKRCYSVCLHPVKIGFGCPLGDKLKIDEFVNRHYTDFCVPVEHKIGTKHFKVEYDEKGRFKFIEEKKDE